MKTYAEVRQQVVEERKAADEKKGEPMRTAMQTISALTQQVSPELKFDGAHTDHAEFRVDHGMQHFTVRATARPDGTIKVNGGPKNSSIELEGHDYEKTMRALVLVAEGWDVPNDE